MVVQLPTGTVTMLFTDIEGSTRLLGSLGDDYGMMLRAHRAILREAVGQGALTFDQALDYAAAWADQRSLAATPRGG